MPDPDTVWLSPLEAVAASLGRAGLVVTSIGGAFVDDQNLIPLAGYTRVDARAGIPFGPARMTIDLMNALDRHYDATAFPDPAGSAVTYRYPAAGRMLIVGIESR